VVLHEARQTVWVFYGAEDEPWRCRKAGESLHEIGRAFGKEHSSIRCLVARQGRIVPAVRRRSRRVLRHLELIALRRFLFVVDGFELVTGFPSFWQIFGKSLLWRASLEREKCE
jgi:hypothetical protein